MPPHRCDDTRVVYIIYTDVYTHAYIPIICVQIMYASIRAYTHMHVLHARCTYTHMYYTRILPSPSSTDVSVLTLAEGRMTTGRRKLSVQIYLLPPAVAFSCFP